VCTWSKKWDWPCRYRCALLTCAVHLTRMLTNLPSAAAGLNGESMSLILSHWITGNKPIWVAACLGDTLAGKSVCFFSIQIFRSYSTGFLHHWNPITINQFYQPSASAFPVPTYLSATSNKRKRKASPRFLLSCQYPSRSLHTKGLLIVIDPPTLPSLSLFSFSLSASIYIHQRFFLVFPFSFGRFRHGLCFYFASIYTLYCESTQTERAFPIDSPSVPKSLLRPIIEVCVWVCLFLSSFLQSFRAFR